jgi:lysophospholipase L1-like esterase
MGETGEPPQPSPPQPPPPPGPALPEGGQEQALPPPSWLSVAIAVVILGIVLAWFVAWWARGAPPEPEEDDPPAQDAAAAMDPIPDSSEAASVPEGSGSSDAGGGLLAVRPAGPDVEAFAGVAHDLADWTVLGLGDSWMAGAEAPPGTAFISVLGRLVHERSGRLVHVRNLGVGGSNSGQAYLSLRDAIDDVAPDLIVVTTGVNDTHNEARQDEVDAELSGRAAGEAKSTARVSYDDPLTTSPYFAFWEKGDFEGGLVGVESGTEATELDRGAWRALFTYGDGRLDEARADAQKLLVAGGEGNHPLVLLTLGLTDYAQGRINRGSLYLSRLAESGPSWFRDLAFGLWAMDRGHSQIAQQSLGRALARVPDSPEAQWAAHMVPEEMRNAEFQELVDAMAPARPEPWYLVVSAERNGELPAGLETLAETSPSRRLVEAIVGHRQDNLTDASQVALALADDPASPLWLRAHALAQAIIADSEADPAGSAALRARLHKTYSSMPVPLMAALEFDWERTDLCSQRMRNAELLLKAGGNIVETLARLADCAAPGALDDLDDRSLVAAADGLERIWASGIAAAAGHTEGVDEATLTARLNARLDAMLALAQKQGAPLVVVNYAFPDERHPEASARLAAWAAARDVVLVDTWSAVRTRLTDAQWTARTTPLLHLDGEGYRLMGEEVFRKLDEGRILPR